MNDLHEGFLDDLTSLVEGDDATLERWADYLAEHEEARDLRHDAEDAVRDLEGAGADYAHPADFNARLMAALDARVQKPHAEAKQPPAEPARAELAAVPSTETRADASAQEATPKEQTSKRRGRVLFVGTSVCALAAAAAAALLMRAPEYDVAVPVPDEVSNALSASVERVVGGELLVGGSPVEVGAHLPAGSRLQTDGRTRVELALSDGTRLIVDRDSTLMLSDAGRDVRLESGVLVADVAHLDQGPAARFLIPVGEVEVLGTKFVLTADGEEGSVRVTRGAVRVHGEGESVEVKAGEEGRMHAGRAPQVSPATQLAASMAWSDLESDRAGVGGLGELRARRPGEREETERPLRLASHSVSARIVGPMARTEVHEVFRNDSADVLEGDYVFPMPAGARIARLQLKVDGEWQEGAFVDKRRGEQIWRGVIRRATPERNRAPVEEFIWVPGPWRDPALLEWQQGGRFRLRIFPIPAHGQREIRIVYEQTVAPYGEGRRYVYPLPLATSDESTAERFSFDVRVAGNAHVKARGYELSNEQEAGASRLRMRADNFVPAGDLLIDYESADDATLRTWTYRGDATATPGRQRRGDRSDVHARMETLDQDERAYALFALRPELPFGQRPPSSDYLVVVDTSQSMVGERRERALAIVHAITQEMDRRDRILVAACDRTCRLSGSPVRPSARIADDFAEFIRKDAAAGSSDIAFAIRDAASQSREGGAGAERPLHVVYIGDGVASTGLRSPAGLARDLQRAASGYTVSTVGIGQDADDRALRAIATAAGGQYVPYVPGQRPMEAAFAVLESTYGAHLEDARLELPEGLSLAAPSKLPVLRAGEELLVAARVSGTRIRGDIVLRGKVGDEPFEARYAVNTEVGDAAGNAFVPRLWATQRIEELERSGGEDARDEIVALSRSYAVMSRSTSLLVLESEAMFRAFGVDRARASLEWTGEETMQYESLGGDVGTRGRTNAATSSGVLGSLRNRSAGAPRRSQPAARPMAARTALDAFEEPEEADSRAERALEASTDASAQAAVRSPGQVGLGGDGNGRARRRMTRRPSRMTWERRRRVVVREGAIRTQIDRTRAMGAVREAESALRLQPDSRDRHRTLVRALSRAGELERAEEVATDWLGRDALDWEALTYLSDAVGRQGKTARALRLLSGVVDLQADNVVLHQRMAAAYERSGDAERACAHRTSLAEIGEDVADAVRCQRALGRAHIAEFLLANLNERERSRVLRAAEAPARPPRTRGPIRARASWNAAVQADLDLSFITREGTRVSWMGGLRAAFGENGTSTREETLGLRSARPGTYFVEIQRADASGSVSGEVRLEVYGAERTIPFTLRDGEHRAVLGEARVIRRTRWETVRDAGGWRP